MLNTTPAVLISSAGAKIPLIHILEDATQRTLTKPRIICGDSNEKALSRYFVKEFWVMKPLGFYSDEELISELTLKNVKLIIPTRDGELEFWSRKRHVLQDAGIHVLVSSPEALVDTIDKLQFSKWLKLRNLPYIETWQEPDTIVENQIVIKERFASAPKNTLVNVKGTEAKNLSIGHQNAIYQEFIEGIEISVDVWISSQSVSTSARTRDLIIDGEARVTSSFPNREVEEIAKRIATGLNLWGPCVIQFIMRKDGNIFPIECNARIGGASTFSIRNRFDSMYLYLCELFGEEPKNFRILNNKSIQVRALTDYYF